VGKEKVQFLNLRAEPPCLCGIYAFASNLLAPLAFSLLSYVRWWKLNLSPVIYKAPVNPV